MTSQEDDLKSQEGNLTGRQHHWKIALRDDDLTGLRERESIGRQLYRITNGPQIKTLIIEVDLERDRKATSQEQKKRTSHIECFIGRQP